ncbi:hypothetical protein R50076_14990 [Gilvimarinus japonicus]
MLEVEVACGRLCHAGGWREREAGIVPVFTGSVGGCYPQPLIESVDLGKDALKLCHDTGH